MSTITTPTIFTFRNERSGETVSTSRSAEETLRIFRETAPGDSWLWFWLVKHANANAHRCNGNTPIQAPEAPCCKDLLAFLADSFLLALGMGLKRPMIRLHFKGQRYKLYLSARGTVCIKTGHLAVDQSSPPGAPVSWTNDPVGDEEYMGCLFQGKFLPARPTLSDGRKGPERCLSEGEKETLDGLRTDPAGFLAKCSKDMCRCVYCYKALEDQRSKDVGYGKTCAEHWGLPWGKSYDEKVPSFADLWSKGRPDDKASIRGLCLSIRQARQARGAENNYELRKEEAFLWEMLGDALTDLGFPKRPTMPEDGVKMPSA